MSLFWKSVLIFSMLLNGVLIYHVLALREEVDVNKTFMLHAEEEAREQRILADEQMKMAAIRQQESEAVREECERHLATCRKQ